MAGYGVPEADIAGVVAIDPKTLRKHYSGELKNGHVKANAKVAENLFRKATGDGREAVIAAIFWMKTRAGWKETLVQEHSGGASPIVAIKHYIVDPASPKKEDKVLDLHAEPASQPVSLSDYRIRA